MKSLLLIFIFLTFSCQDKSNDIKASESPEIKGTFKAGAKTFSMASFKVSASENVFKTPGAPKPKVIEKCLLENFKENRFFVEKGGNSVDVKITYDLLNEKSKSIVLLAEMREQGPEARSFSAGERTHAVGTPLLELGKESCSNLVKKLTNSLEVGTASKEDLVAILSNKESTPAILKNAIQSIREQKITEAAPKLSELLEHEDAKVGVAAAASLSSFKYFEARPGVLKLTERLSRDRNPSYLPMLYILAEMGGTDIDEYLRTVASSHEKPRVREAAKKAIEKAKEKNKAKN